jgi:hypothetical protein
MACKTRRASRRRAKTSIYDWCRRHRHWSIQAQHAALHRRLRGHFNYFGVSGNYNSMMRLVEATKRAWYKGLRRRSQRPRLHWERCTDCFTGGLCHVLESPSGCGTASHEPHQRKSRMVEISSSGSGEGPGEGNRPAYSTTRFFRAAATAVDGVRERIRGALGARALGRPVLGTLGGTPTTPWPPGDRPCQILR